MHSCSRKNLDVFHPSQPVSGVFPQGYPNAQIKDSQCRINLAKHISGRENEKHRFDSIHFLSLESKVREIKLLRGLKVVISAKKHCQTRRNDMMS